ncbi:unnamed protein product [Amoebophrya sp. A25]|nr:unnamed protein product [Amoebophrya sp. A25]|eukprot:GSA25T00006042001.1
MVCLFRLYKIVLFLVFPIFQKILKMFNLLRSHHFGDDQKKWKMSVELFLVDGRGWIDLDIDLSYNIFGLFIFRQERLVVLVTANTSLKARTSSKNFFNQQNRGVKLQRCSC